MAVISTSKFGARLMLLIAFQAIPAEAVVTFSRDAHTTTVGNLTSHHKLAFVDGAGGSAAHDLDPALEGFGQSVSRLDAADLILAQLAPAAESSAMAAPENVETNVSPNGEQWQIDLVWTAFPGPPGALFVVELVTIPSDADGESELVAFAQTEAAAATVYVDRVPVGLAFRVSQVAADGSDYAPGVWTELSPGTERSNAESTLDPVGRVTIRVGAADESARQLARELASGLGAGGVWIHLVEVEINQSDSTVSYRYAADADLAASVADYLPVLGPQDAVRLPDLPAAPGEIVVTLVGGPIVGDEAD